MVNHALIFASRTNYWERSSGAHRIATYLRQHEMDVEVVDFAAHWDLELLKEFTRKSVKPTTLFFGFSIFFSFWNQTLSDFSAWLKVEYPNIKTVAGGQSILDSSLTNIDIWVDSYGEEAMLAVVKNLAGNSSAGLKFSVEHFGDKKVIKALESYPAYNLKDYANILEARDFVEPWEWLTVEFSRGCKFSCAFCNFPVLGVKEDTSRSQESFEYEMKHNYDMFGVNRYYVADETFNDRVEKITKFADVVERLNFDTFFSGFIRADLLSQPNMIEELSRMNFGGQFYGIETFDRQSGKVIGKGLDPDKVKNLLLDTKNYFKSQNKTYRGTISLIVGLPYDTEDHWNNNRDWLTKNWMSESVSIFPLGVGKSESTNQSKFSQNLKKYGLRETSTRTYQHMEFIKNPMYNKTEIMWEHDSMNIYQARQIADSMQVSFVHPNPLDSWQMGWPETLLQQKIADLDKHIGRSKAQIFLTLQKTTGVPQIVQAYSLKKLR